MPFLIGNHYIPPSDQPHAPTPTLHSCWPPGDNPKRQLLPASRAFPTACCRLGVVQSFMRALRQSDRGDVGDVGWRWARVRAFKGMCILSVKCSYASAAYAIASRERRRVILTGHWNR